jgi:outer membrane immunogenic protein
MSKTKRCTIHRTHGTIATLVTSRLGPALLGPACLAAFVTAAPPTATAADWSGPYAGIGLGYAAADDEAREINGPRVYIPKLNGFNGSAYIGWQRQIQNVVAGVEVEGGFLNLGSSVTRDVTGGFITSGADLGAYAAFSGRLGLVVGSEWLLYSRAGMVVGKLAGKTVQTCTGPDLCAGAQSSAVSAAETRDVSVGLLLGGGIERQFGANWTGRVDYQFMNFRKELALPPIDGPGWNHQVEAHAIKLGLSYRFPTKGAR